MFKRKIGKYIFTAPANRKGKKYSVYDAKTKQYITSFGQLGYQHYYDKIGHYSHLNHEDKARRTRYRIRHRNDHISDDSKAGFYSWKFLW